MWYVCVHMCAFIQKSEVNSGCLPLPYFLRQDVLLNLELINWVSLTSPVLWGPPAFAFLPSTEFTDMWLVPPCLASGTFQLCRAPSPNSLIVKSTNWMKSGNLTQEALILRTSGQGETEERGLFVLEGEAKLFKQLSGKDCITCKCTQSHATVHWKLEKWWAELCKFVSMKRNTAEHRAWSNSVSRKWVSIYKVLSRLWRAVSTGLCR